MLALESVTGAPFHQAAGLMQLANQSPRKAPRVIAVSSGKGGVGKTTISVNLATAFAAAGQRTVLMDADFGLANVDVMLGLTPHHNLSHVLEGSCRLQDTVLEGPQGLKIIPAASGIRRMAELTLREQAGLIHAFSDWDEPLDVMIIDTAAGIAGNVTTFAQAAQEVIVVACSEPASITDAYALIKVLSRDCQIRRVQILANQVRSPAEGREIYDNIARVAARFLDINLIYLGAIPHDDWLRRAIRRQQPVLEAYPHSPSAQAFRELSAEILSWAPPRSSRGHLEFFVERLNVNGAAVPLLSGVAT